MKPELEALYEGLCRREPALFEPEALHKQLDACTSRQRRSSGKPCCSCVRSGRSTPLRWGYGCRPDDDNIITACRPTGRGLKLRVQPLSGVCAGVVQARAGVV